MSIDRGAALRLALATGAGGLVLALLGVLVAVSTDSSTAGLVARAVLVTALLLAAVPVFLSGRPSERVLPTAAVGLAAGYVLTLGWFEGQVYAARLVTDSGVVGALLDLVLWMAVGLAATRLVRSRPDQPSGYR